MNVLSRLSLILFPLLFTACAQFKDIPGPAATVTREQALDISRAYTQLVWKSTQANLMHGTDADGIRVDTPDATVQKDYPGAWWRVNAKSKGMPYKWGGWDTPNEFLSRIKSDEINGGKPAAAGDMGLSSKQAGGDDVVSRFAAGVDCSGFVSRCWRLDKPHSTRELPALCAPIERHQLKTGDILIIPGTHVLMFISWANDKHERFLGCEAGPLPVWRCGEHHFNYARLQSLGYRPMRYQGMKD